MHFSGTEKTIRCNSNLLISKCNSLMTRDSLFTDLGEINRDFLRVYSLSLSLSHTHTQNEHPFLHHHLIIEDRHGR